MTSLASWVAALSTNKRKAKTIKAYLTGVRSAHIDLGYEDLTVFHSPQLQRIVNGIRRLQGEADSKERQPITKEILLQLLSEIDRSTKHGATIYASFCLAFAAFLRIGEFTYTTHDRQDEDFEK